MVLLSRKYLSKALFYVDLWKCWQKTALAKILTNWHQDRWQVPEFITIHVYLSVFLFIGHSMRNGRLELSSWTLPLFRVQCQSKIDWSKKCALFGLLLGFTYVPWYVNNLLSFLGHQNPLTHVPFLPIIQREKMLHTQRSTNNNCYC